jgi:hypothetical protein
MQGFPKRVKYMVEEETGAATIPACGDGAGVLEDCSRPTLEGDSGHSPEERDDV